MFFGDYRGSIEPPAPYGTERKVQQTSIKWALLRLSAEGVIPPECTTGKGWRLFTPFTTDMTHSNVVVIVVANYVPLALGAAAPLSRNLEFFATH